MSLSQSGARVIHFPADPQKFVFDREVANCFPDMAQRSIPGFYEAHEMHARMLRSWLGARYVPIADFGASRGAFLHALQNYYGSVALDRAYAIDMSEEMCEMMRADFPQVSIEQVDITSRVFLSDEFNPQFTVVNLNYVLQFIDPGLQRLVLRKVMNMVQPGGVFIYGAKEKDITPIGQLLHEQYIQFRINHGYTKEEIEAKTTALKNSMWPTTRKWFMDEAKLMGFSVRETTRHSVFATYFCIRDGGAHGAG